jgi:hypothetical protein
LEVTIINRRGGNSVTQKRHTKKNNTLEKQVSKMQKEINHLKKALNVKNISSPRKNNNLLQSIDPAKINEWISILSNPAIMDLLKQFTSKPEAPEQPAVSRKRRRFLF